MTIFHWVANALLLTVMSGLAWQDWRTLRSGPTRRTNGTVVDHRRSVDDGAEYLAAGIQFCCDQARQFVIEDSVGRAKPTPAVGSTIALVYPVANPSQGRVPRPGLRILNYAGLLGALGLITASGMRLIS